MNLNTKNVETQIAESGSEWINAPWAGVAKVIHIGYGESSSKGTAGMEIVIQAAPPKEGFKEEVKKFPATKAFQEEYREKVEINLTGPVSTQIFWMTEKTMDPQEATSVFHKTLQIVDAIGVRAEFDAIEKNSYEDWANAFAEVATGQKAGFLLRKLIEEYEKDGTIRETIKNEFPPFEKFCVSAGEVNDLKTKLANNPDKYVEEKRKAKSTNKTTQDVVEEEIDF